MFILNAGLSHKSRDWLMSLTTEIEKIKRRLSLEKRCWLIQTEIPFGYLMITEAVELGFRLALYGWKVKT